MPSTESKTRRGPYADQARPERPGRLLRVSSQKHWRAITSPTRFEILEQMRSAGPCSVAELARQMDRPADGLYHHLRILLGAGLIQEVGQRSTGRQVEAVYDASYDGMIFDIDPESGRGVEELQRLIGALLRLVGRVFDAAVTNPNLSLSGPHQNAWGRLDTTWLTDEGLAKVNHHLQAIRQLVIEGNARREGQLMTIGTFGGPALRPRRANGASREPGSSRPKGQKKRSTTSKAAATRSSR